MLSSRETETLNWNWNRNRNQNWNWTWTEARQSRQTEKAANTLRHSNFSCSHFALAHKFQQIHNADTDTTDTRYKWGHKRWQLFFVVSRFCCSIFLFFLWFAAAYNLISPSIYLHIQNYIHHIIALKVWLQLVSLPRFKVNYFLFFFLDI